MYSINFWKSGRANSNFVVGEPTKMYDIKFWKAGTKIQSLIRQSIDIGNTYPPLVRLGTSTWFHIGHTSGCNLTMWICNSFFDLNMLSHLTPCPLCSVLWDAILDPKRAVSLHPARGLQHPTTHWSLAEIIIVCWITLRCRIECLILNRILDRISEISQNFQCWSSRGAVEDKHILGLGQ